MRAGGAKYRRVPATTVAAAVAASLSHVFSTLFFLFSLFFFFFAIFEACLSPLRSTLLTLMLLAATLSSRSTTYPATRRPRRACVYRDRRDAPPMRHSSRPGRWENGLCFSLVRQTGFHDTPSAIPSRIIWISEEQPPHAHTYTCTRSLNISRTKRSAARRNDHLVFSSSAST